MKHAIQIVLVLLFPLASVAATNGTVESVMFESSVTPPATRLPPALQNKGMLFRASLGILPEGLVVMGALSLGGGQLGLSNNQATNLAPLVSDVYSRIGKDPAFAKTPSALPYCFSAEKPASGHYFMYQPTDLPKDPVCIVFLHGYGGNFQFYTWVLKEEFPNAIILSPSWSTSWFNGSTRYLTDMLADAERRAEVRFRERWLMGISAGGRGGFPIYNAMPSRFAGYVCIANVPRTPTARSLRKDLRILMLNGTQDAMVPLAAARKQMAIAKRRVPTLQYREIKGNHFFLLSDRTTTFDAIRAFMKP